MSCVLTSASLVIAALPPTDFIDRTFAAWKSEVDPEEREQQQLMSFFDKRDSKKVGASEAKATSIDQQADAMTSIAEEGRKTGDDGLEDGTMDWQGFRKLITDTPGLEALVPSVLGPVLDQTRQAHERRHILGWMGADEFERKCADKDWHL